MEIQKSDWKRRLPWILSGTAALLVAVALFYPACRWQRVLAAQDKEAPHATSSDQSTSLSDQTDLNVTVYNTNIALVRDVRNLNLPSGAFRLKFMDIAATVNPATVHFRSLTDAAKLAVVEQNYEYDLLEPAKLLHKYVGKEITLERSYFDNNTTKREQIKATLLAGNSGTVWKIGDDIVTNPAVESYHFPE